MSLPSSVSGVRFSTAQSISELRAEIDNLSRQLSTGKKAQSLSEMGNFLSRSIDLRSRLARLSVYDDAI
jgi:flagellin-like hook-associated protein FlgL